MIPALIRHAARTGTTVKTKTSVFKYWKTLRALLAKYHKNWLKRCLETEFDECVM